MLHCIRNERPGAAEEDPRKSEAAEESARPAQKASFGEQTQPPLNHYFSQLQPQRNIALMQRLQHQDSTCLASPAVRALDLHRLAMSVIALDLRRLARLALLHLEQGNWNVLSRYLYPPCENVYYIRNSLWQLDVDCLQGACNYI